MDFEEFRHLDRLYDRSYHSGWICLILTGVMVCATGEYILRPSFAAFSVLIGSQVVLAISGGVYLLFRWQLRREQKRLGWWPR